MIPGPIEYESAVLNSMSLPSLSHTSKEFVSVHREVLQNLMPVFQSKESEGTPFVISGSGTLGMEASTVNFIERNSKVLVINTGHFGDRFVELLSRFTNRVDVLKPPFGEPADPKIVAEKLENNDYDLITATHVDTSTALKNDIKRIADVAKGTGAILVVDGVCSVGGEELDMGWGVDVAFTASQKALGTPPGLAIGMVGPKAMARMEKVPPMTYFSDLRKWISISKAALDLKPGYFGTPNVNLILALNTSLKGILAEGIDRRLKRHEIIANAIREAVSELGLDFIPKSSFANTVSAVNLPEKVELKKFLADAEASGAVFASGIIKEIRDKYFRIGHMGSVGSSEVMIAVGAMERSLKSNGYDVELGRGLKAAQEVIYRSGM